ncbi:serine hydrolase domain-containing protein [Streptomyces sp. NPDC015220]|uniref:serine hydrolase domain-containing protein n=1 Tax=Streptomyces sp. NPDC015220 TaxID=3364947 RepID=UPI00370165F2
MTSRQRFLILVAAVVTAVLCATTPAGAAGGKSPASSAGSPAPEGRSGLGALLDGLVRRQLSEYRIPGASVVVVRRDGSVLSRGYGQADVARGVRSDPERTGYFMASDAKLFTAVAVLQQVERGKLALDTDVNRYLKHFRIKNTYPGHPVTVRQLLTHTAGFDASILGRGGTSPEPAGALGESLAAHQPARVRPPGRVASYDNYGVALAGHLVEQVTGVPFASYVERSVLRPLGMTRTTFAAPGARTRATLAVGYRPGDGGQRAEDGQYGAWTPTGAGAITTAADMGRLMRALLDDGGPVLASASARAMLHRQFGNDPRLPGLGYVLEERDRDGMRMWVKDGDLPGFHGNLALLPGAGVGVYVVYNGDGTDGAASYAGQELVDRVADELAAGGDGGGQGASAPGKTAAAARSAALRGSASGAAAYGGYYRSTRTSGTDLTRAAALTSAVHVGAAADGTLTTTGLSRDPRAGEQHWLPVAPGVFQERGGQDRIAFRDGRLALASDPTEVFELLPWYASPVLHQRALLGGLGVVGLAVVLVPLTALVRRRRAAERPRGARVAWALGWATGALLTAATVCFVLLTGDGNALNRAVLVGDSPLLTLIPALVAAALAGTALLAVCTVLAWRRRWWRLPGRVTFTCHTLGAAVVVGLASCYGLLP